MDPANQGLESRLEPLLHCVWRQNADLLKIKNKPFTQNSLQTLAEEVSFSLPPSRLIQFSQTKKLFSIYPPGLSNPVRYIGDDKGRLRGVECVRMELGEPDSSGRRRPVVVPGSVVLIGGDQLLSVSFHY